MLIDFVLKKFKMFMCISEWVKFCILLLMVNFFFVYVYYMILLRFLIFSCLDVFILDIVVNNKFYMIFCGKGRKIICFII